MVLDSGPGVVKFPEVEAPGGSKGGERGTRPMQQYEYKVVPAPRRGEKARGVKRTEDRFARTLAEAINELAADGWEYQRAETLPCEERTGLTGRVTNGFQSVLVFRRRLAPAVARPEPAAEQPVLRAAAPALAPAQRPASEGFGPAARPEAAALPRLAPLPTVPPTSVPPIPAPPLGPATGAAATQGPAPSPAPNRGDQAAG